MGNARYYVRDSKVTIGKRDVDIVIPTAIEEFILKGEELYSRVRKAANEKMKGEVSVRKIMLGDSISVGNLLITFYKDYIEVDGETEGYQCNLLPYKHKALPFDGFPYYKKSPRIVHRVHPETVNVKKPPRKENMSKSSLAQVIIPPVMMMAVTVFMSIFMKRGLYVIASICMTGVTTIFSVQRFINEKKEIKKKNQQRDKVYTDYLVRLRGYIRKQRAKERQVLEYQIPAVEILEKMVLSYNSRLYERAVEDEDFLQINLGYCDGESEISVLGENDELNMEQDELLEESRKLVEDFEKIKHIPVNVNLRRANLGIVGDIENIHNQLKYFLMQLCFFHSYHDLQIIFIGNEKYEEEFAYLRWYPHLRIKAINAVSGIFRSSIRDQILGSILQIVKDRKQKVDENNKEALFLPHLLFFIDETKLIQDHAIMEYLGKESRKLGISIIYTTDQVAKLPENIGTVCVLDNSETGRLIMREGVRCEENFETVSIEAIDVEKVSRRCAALIHEKGMVSRIPESITFFEMYHISKPEELNAPTRWNSHEAHKSLAVPLGVREQDSYVELNLHEKAHGPHGLVAGTTGSGKSEIVQSYILSLAVNFHPYEVGFLLIDYKGGGMANLFQNLPHLLGTITNLDGAESYRAMVSIKSELARRQRIFNEHGVNHINGYHKLYKLGRAQEPIPHLFLISDEFVELKKEQPEFMKELVQRIINNCHIHLPDFPPTALDFLAVATATPSKICLVSEKSFYVNIAETYYSLY